MISPRARVMMEKYIPPTLNTTMPTNKATIPDTNPAIKKLGQKGHSRLTVNMAEV
jgi:hypothetical protein